MLKMVVLGRVYNKFYKNNKLTKTPQILPMGMCEWNICRLARFIDHRFFKHIVLTKHFDRWAIFTEIYIGLI